MVTRWLITGGCGFIGRNLIRNLLNEGGHFIRVVDNLSVGSKDDLSQVCEFKEVDKIDISPKISGRKGVELVVADILEEETAIALVEGMDVIVHLAANTGVGPSVENPRMDCVTNVIGTFNYLEAARTHKVKRFIFASSGAPAGEVDPPIHEEMAPHPVSPYGASKLAGEGYCSAYYRSFGVETICLRFGNVYGPYSSKKESVVAKFIKKALNGETLEIYGDGTQTRDFIYIDDLVNAVRLAQTTQGIGGEIFQIATNKETTVEEMVGVLTSVLNEKGIKNFKVINGEKRLGDVMRNFSDTSKARVQLAWAIKIDLSTGLKKTSEWFLEQ